jgi:hypothetical protein
VLQHILAVHRQSVSKRSGLSGLQMRIPEAGQVRMPVDPIGKGLQQRAHIL